jgi:hypothetical protein
MNLEVAAVDPSDPVTPGNPASPVAPIGPVAPADLEENIFIGFPKKSTMIPLTKNIC